MIWFQALVLGMVQGLTEFLPVSSSAHLVFVQHLLGFREPLVFFDVVLHLGTLAALFIYFAPDLAHLIRDSIQGVSYLIRGKPMAEIAQTAPYARWALGILVASVPTGLAGIFLKDFFEALFGSLRAVGFLLFGTSLLLGLTRFFQKTGKGIEQASRLDFFIIGLFQGVAIAPGISRSGSTIAGALFRGLKREEAFRFSFLLAIPAILGAALVELKDGAWDWAWGWPPLLAGFAVSALFGYLSLHGLAQVIRRGRLHWFGVYTFFFGFLVLALSRRFE